MRACSGELEGIGILQSYSRANVKSDVIGIVCNKIRNRVTEASKQEQMQLCTGIERREEEEEEEEDETLCTNTRRETEEIQKTTETVTWRR